MSKQKRAWQRMLSGRRLDLLDPSPLDIEIDDIAHGLARVARWNGQTIGEYAFSVAQHSILVEKICRRLEPDLEARWLMAALLHDAAEYVIGDLISPFKSAVGANYKDVEMRILSAIYLRFGLPGIISDKISKLIKRADGVSAFYEAINLAGFDEREAAELFGRPRAVPMSSEELKILSPLPTSEAQNLFLTRFSELERSMLQKQSS